MLVVLSIDKCLYRLCNLCSKFFFKCWGIYNWRFLCFVFLLNYCWYNILFCNIKWLYWFYRDYMCWLIFVIFCLEGFLFVFSYCSVVFRCLFLGCFCLRWLLDYGGGFCLYFDWVFFVEVVVLFLVVFLIIIGVGEFFVFFSMLVIWFVG